MAAILGIGTGNDTIANVMAFLRHSHRELKSRRLKCFASMMKCGILGDSLKEVGSNLRMKEILSNKKLVISHYDTLIDENNDPFYDPQHLRIYMDKWDGSGFIEQMALDESKSVLEIGVGTGRLAIRVAPLCRELWGIDISPKNGEPFGFKKRQTDLRRFSFL